MLGASADQRVSVSGDADPLFPEVSLFRGNMAVERQEAGHQLAIPLGEARERLWLARLLDGGEQLGYGLLQDGHFRTEQVLDGNIGSKPPIPIHDAHTYERGEVSS